MFQFVADRNAQGANFGPGGCVNRADQSQFVSIWGKVDGTGHAVFTADQVQNGDIYSADGKANIGGTPVMWKGKPHTVTANGNTYQEFQVEKSHMEKWNRYEAQQSNDMTRNFMAREHAKAASHGRLPDIKIDHMDVPMEAPQFDVASPVTVPVQGMKRERTPAQLANDQRLREKAAAKKTAEAAQPPS